MRTNDLFRDLLDNKIPGHETPRTVWVNIMPELHQQPDTINEWALQMNLAINRAYENLRMAAMGALRTTLFTGHWIDYGAQRGLEGLERAHFNDAVEKMTLATGWNREDCARNMGLIMDAAERAELKYMPADPRERAMRAKQCRNHGPALEPLRVRGRTNRYRTKG